MTTTASGVGANPASAATAAAAAASGPLSLLQPQPQLPRVTKPWHEKITTDMRKHLIQKIVQTIFPTQDPKIYTDPRLNNLVNYASRTECDMYEAAKDQEEYFHLLAERIYKIQKEFEDKQQKNQKQLQSRQQQQQQQQQATGAGNLTINSSQLDPSGHNLANNNNHSDFQNQLNQLNAFNSGIIINHIYLFFIFIK